MTDDLTIDGFRETVSAIESEIARVIVGQRDVVRHVIIGLVAGGHVLLEGVPGLGKTMLVRTLAQVLDLSFARLQFTPDLMPADIVGTDILEEDDAGRRHFRFQPGPIFAHLILADEVNRATPKTQSALLEAMQERTVTVAHQTYPLPEPFFVMATQNPIEMEGTYPLPEAQVDRFLFKLNVGFPAAGELGEILDRTTYQTLPQASPVADGPAVQRLGELARQVPIAAHVRDYAVNLLLATHPEHPSAPDAVRRYVRYGGSPRGAQAMILGAKVAALLDGRYNVAFEDLRALALPSLRHRVLLNFEGEAEGITPRSIVEAVLDAVPEEELK
jgi:MoxR-like ATPase